MDRDDVRMAELALQRKWVTQEQIDECLVARADDPDVTGGRETSRPLAVILAEKKLITDGQCAVLMEETRTRVRKKPAVGSRPVGEILLDLGMITREQLDGALAEQAQGAPRRRLGEILVERGSITYDQLLEALRRQQKTVMMCTSCRAQFNVVNHRSWNEYHCKRCDGLLEVYLPGLTGSGGALPPEVEAAAQDARNVVGDYVLLHPVLEGLHAAWKFSTGGSVFLSFLEGEAGPEEVARLFRSLQEQVLGQGFTLVRIVEIAEAEGRRFAIFQ